VLLVFAGMTAKAHFVLDQAHSSYFFYMFCIDFGAQALLALLAVTSSVDLEPQSYEAIFDLVSPSSQSGGYALLTDEEALPRCPEARAGLFSRLTFAWMGELMWQGYEKPLEANDVWSVDDADRAGVLLDDFDRAWECEVAAKGGPAEASLFRVLVRVHGWDFFRGGCYKVFNDASQFVGPAFLTALLDLDVCTGGASWPRRLIIAHMSIYGNNH